MISRVADHCFWMGRYLERVESTSRVLRVTSSLVLDAILPPEQVWTSALAVSGEEKPFAERHGAAAVGDGFRVTEFLTWDPDVPSSLARSLQAARENARSIREVVSLEAWEAINELHVWLNDGSGRREWAVRPDAFYRQVRTGTQLILGAVEHTMLHDNAFDFIMLGVFLERVGQTARILDVHHHALMQLPPDLVREETLWLSLLRACAGFEPFMKRKAGRVTPGEVATFLILEQRFPRSLVFCLQEADQRLASIRSPGDEAFPPLRCQARLAALATFLASRRVPDEDLHALLTRVVDETAAICGELHEELFQAPQRAWSNGRVERPRAEA
ncbi:MAG: alpha-E domain-containing protein [Myxococcaceae bacterium]|nr:MAG: alpha-E domain-containing protein [Myxococcaceae bacterium]